MIANFPPPDWQPSERWTLTESGRSSHFHGLAWSASVNTIGRHDGVWLSVRGCGTDATDWMLSEVSGNDRWRLALYRGEALVRLLDAGTIAEVRR